MEPTDTSKARASESGSDEGASKGAQANGGTGTRRKLNDQQEKEVTRLYAETETPVSEISKRFGIGESSVYRVAQRHGAALRGRTSTASAPRPRAAVAAVAKPATGRGSRRGRRAAATSTASTAPATTGATAPAAAAVAPATSNGRRRGAAGRAKPAATAGRRAAGTGPVARATRTPRAAAVARREFRVSYTAVRVFVAENMADAIRQAEAAGATDITGIERSA